MQWLPHSEEGDNGAGIGGLLITALTGYFVYEYYREFKTDENGNPLMKSLSAGLLGAFIALAVGGIAEYNFGAAVVWIQLTFMMGLAEGHRKMIVSRQ